MVHFQSSATSSRSLAHSVLPLEVRPLLVEYACVCVCVRPRKDGMLAFRKQTALQDKDQGAPIADNGLPPCLLAPMLLFPTSLSLLCLTQSRMLQAWVCLLSPNLMHFSARKCDCPWRPSWLFILFIWKLV